MSKDLFRTVRKLLDSRNNVAGGDAVSIDGQLYEDSVENLNALRMLEPSLRELIEVGMKAGLGETMCFREVAECLGIHIDNPNREG